MEIIAYEMQLHKDIIEPSNILCIPFEEKYFTEYMHMYNECFYEMRKALDIVPYNFLSDYEQIKEKIKNIYLFMENSFCYGEYNILAKIIMNLVSCM